MMKSCSRRSIVAVAAAAVPGRLGGRRPFQGTVDLAMTRPTSSMMSLAVLRFRCNGINQRKPSFHNRTMMGVSASFRVFTARIARTDSSVVTGDIKFGSFLVRCADWGISISPLGLMDKMPDRSFQSVIGPIEKSFWSRRKSRGRRARRARRRGCRGAPLRAS
jgi:hypothetical protein